MAKNTGIAALFDRSYRTGDPQLDALFGLTDIQEEELPPLRAPERREAPREEREEPQRAQRQRREPVALGGKATPYDDLIYQKAIAAGQDPNLIKAQIWAESSFNPKAVSPVGAQGLTQFMPGTWNKYGRGSPFDPNAAIDAQIAYNADLLRRFGGDERKVLAAYNWGEHRKSYALPDWESHAPKETRDYVKKILAKREEYAGGQAQPVSSPQLASTQAPQEPQESPYYPVRLSDGQIFDVEKGMELSEVAAMLKQNGIDATPLRPYTAPDGQEFDVEYDMTDDEINGMLAKQAQPAEESNYLGGAKYNMQQAVAGIAQGAGTEIGELGKAIDPYSSTIGGYLQEKGPQLHAYGEQLGKDIEGTYQRPKGLNAFEENFAYPLVETLGGVAPYAGAFMVPGVGTGLGAAAVHAGSMGELESRAEAQGKEFVPSEARPYAVLDDVANMIGLGATNKLLKAFGQDAILGSREAIKAAVEKGGIEEAKKVVGSRIGNIAKQFLGAEAGTIGGEVTEDVIGRAYTDQPLIGDDAFNEYWETAKQMAPLGGVTGIGRGYAEHLNKNIEVARLEEQADVAEKLEAQEMERAKIENLATIGVTPEQLQKFGVRKEIKGLSEEELLQAYQADLAEKEAAKAAKIAELPENLRDVPYRDAKRFQQMQEEIAAGVPDEEIVPPVEEPVAPAEPVGVAPPVAPEMGAVEVPEAAEIPSPVEVPEAAEIPEPFVRGKAPEAVNPADILGLSNRAGLRKQLQGLDVNNVEDHPKIDAILQKTSATFSAENLTTLENKMKEVQSAQQIPSTGPTLRGSSAQPEILQEGRDQAISSEGMEPSGQRIETPESKGPEEGPIIKEAAGATKSAAELFEPESIEEFKAPGYKSRTRLIEMPIDDFLKLAEKTEEAGFKKERLEGALTAGEKLRELPRLWVNPKEGKQVVMGHEGRHRAMALKRRGYTHMPVRFESGDIRWSEQADPEKFDYKEQWPAELIGENGDVVPFPISRGQAAIEYAPVSAEPQIKEARVSNPDAGIRAVKPEDYSDITDTRGLVQRFKERGTDPELLKLMNTINASPHLGSIPVRWVKEGDKVHPEVAEKFRAGAAAMAAWGQKDGPTLYFRADDPNLREDVLAHEAVHAVTEAAIRRNPEAAKELSHLTEIIGYSLSGEAGFQHDSKKDNLRDFWQRVVKDDPGEMLAYGLTSPSFREALSRYAADGMPFKAYRSEEMLNALRKGQEKPEKVFTAQAPKELTLWDKFVDAVARLFGLPTKRKDEFKRQLNDYLDKKAAYEQKTKDYNTLRPLQERLDTVFKDFLRETSKKGVDFEAGAIKEVKAEAPTPTKDELKQAEERLKAAGLTGKTTEEPLGTKMRRVTNDIFKEGRNTSFTAEHVDIRQPIAKAVQDLPSNVGEKLRSDYIWGAYEQRGNVLQESYRKGFIAMGRDGTLEAIPDAQLAVENIFKRVGKENAKVFGDVLVAHRVRSIRKKDAEIHAQANKLLNMAEQMEDYASTLKDAAKRKKFNASARSLYKAAEKKLEIINWGEGRTEFSEELAKDADKVLAANPHLAREAENVYALLRKQVDLWEQEGMIDKATANEWRSYPNYFPLYKSSATDAKGNKISYDEMLANPTEYIQKYITPYMGRGAKSLPKVHKQEWHQHAVFVEENLLRHLAFFASAAAEHSARKNTAYNMELLGKATRQEHGKGDFVVKFREKGKDVFYKVEDPAAYYALQSAQPLLNPLLKRMRGVGNFARGVMIKNPLFWFRQVFREPLQASLVGRAGVITPFDTLGEIAKIATGKSEGYERLRAKGVIGPVDVVPDVTDYVKSIYKEKGAVTKFFDTWNHTHEAADAATRAVVYERAKAQAISQGFTEEVADSIGVMKAREIINFAKQGRGDLIRVARATTPFFGAALNSLDVMARAISPEKLGSLSKAEAMEARRNFYSTAMMVAMFSTAYAAAMSEDEDYLKNPDRKGNWLIPIGGGKFIKIPIPFEAGWFVKELPELATLLSLGAINKSEAITEGKTAFKENVLPPMPTVFSIEPLAEVIMDHDFYTGSSLEGRDAEVAVRDRNTKAGELTKAIVNKMEDYGVNFLGVSANQLEHLNKSYLGQLWAITRAASDAYLNQGKVTPEKSLSEYPMVGGLLSEGKKDRAVDQFYRVYGQVSEIDKSKQRAVSIGNKERFDQIVNDPENQKALKASDTLRDIKKQIGEKRTGIAKLKEMKGITSEEMTKRINVLKEHEKVLAKRGVEVARKLGLEI